MKKLHGLSLVELLVAITVAGIILATVMTSYVSLEKSSRKIDLSRQLLRETNFALIRIGDRIRNNSIDYSKYSGENAPCSLENTEKLCLKRGIQIEQYEGNLLFAGQPLFSDIFHIQKAVFEVSPEEDPANLGNDQFQPKVQILLKLESAEKNPIKIDPLLLRTTISSRQYE